MIKKYLFSVILFSVIGYLIYLFCQKAETAPQITARDGILYQDGKPCFLVGVWSPTGYASGFSVNSSCPAQLEYVPGRSGQGMKVSFPPLEKPPLSRGIYFNGFDPGMFTEQKAKFLKLWVKGDGSTNVVKFVVERWDGKKSSLSMVLGEFSLADTNWKQFIFPLEGKHEKLVQANCCYLISDTNDKGNFFYLVDDISIEGPSGETVICDFDRQMGASNMEWRQSGAREKVKDDPVYKALWDDPLYQEISGMNFQVIGMNTYHMASTIESGEDPTGLLKGTNQGGFGEVVLCKKLNGMPMIPGFTFGWGAYNGGSEAEKWAKSLDLPQSILQRYPNGSPAGSYMAICFEDPLGNKLFKTVWQKAARRLLAHGANIYAYELINENSGYYVCGCEHNQEMFINRLKDKYKDIETLNRDWGTSYTDFEEIRKQIPKLGSGTNKIKGLTVAWNKFVEDRYVEMLRQGGQWVHEIEDELGKPHALMGQMGCISWEFLGHGGADLYKMARGLDCIQTEGGVGFGGGKYSGELNTLTALTAVMATPGKYWDQMTKDLADAACPDKPIINTEHYVIRYRGEVCRGEEREPTTRADIITSLWEEFLRGASAIHTYSWLIMYLSREEALAVGTWNQCLLSPYVYPRESLNGYKAVNEEISRVAEVVMKRPRLGRNAELAVLFSRPTARYLMGVPAYVRDWKKNHPFYRSHEAVYDYLMENHIPMRYLYEEQLPEGVTGKYRVLLVPHSDNIYPETRKYLTEYVKQGGTLVCFGDALLYDEYGNERYTGESKGLLGLERGQTNIFTETVPLPAGKSVKVTCKREVALGTAEVLVKFPERGTPFITLNKMGKGSVYYVNADMSELGEMVNPLLDYLTEQVQLKSPLEITDMDGVHQNNIEANLISKGKETVVFLVNWKAYLDRVVKVKFRGMEDKDEYYVADIAKNSLYTRGGQETLTGKELRDGINLLLPSQARVILLVTEKKYVAANKPMEVLTDEGARELDKKIKKELEEAFAKEAQAKARQREIMFGLIGQGDYDKIRECIKSVAGDALQEITLLKANSSSDVRVYGLREGASVLTYVLTYKESLKAEEIEAIQDKVIEALVKTFKAKIIKGRSEKSFTKAQTYTGFGSCAPLDIRKQANMGFRDEKADDQKGGLFDEGRSLKNLPVGKQQFAGVPFEIIDPARNNGKACIVLRGQAKPYFPEKAEGIEIKRKTKNVYVLHNACFCGSEGTVYKLRLNYADGSKAEIEIKAGSEIKDWFNRDSLYSFNLSNAKLGWQGKAQGNQGEEIDVGLYCAKLINPYPEKEITTIDIISANGKEVPAIFGITVEENEK